jgi:hypothetical protein
MQTLHLASTHFLILLLNEVLDLGPQYSSVIGGDRELFTPMYSWARLFKPPLWTGFPSTLLSLLWKHSLGQADTTVYSDKITHLEIFSEHLLFSSHFIATHYFNLHNTTVTWPRLLGSKLSFISQTGGSGRWGSFGHTCGRHGEWDLTLTVCLQTGYSGSWLMIATGRRNLIFSLLSSTHRHMVYTST